MKKPFYVGKKGNVSVPVRRYRRGQYTYYLIDDYSRGKRRQQSFSDAEQAKKRADDIAETLAAGERPLLALAPEKREIVNALEAVAPTGLRIDHAVGILVEALKHVQPGEVVRACQHWHDHRPTGLSPKPVAESAKDFLARQKGKISERRHRTNSSYLAALVEKFGPRLLHEVSAVELSDFTSARKWSRKTRNDALCLYSLFWRDGIAHKHARENPASPVAIRRQKVGGSPIGIFTVEESKRLLFGIEDSLKAALALWLFSGCRMAEIARLTVAEVRAGLKSGSVYLEAGKTKTGMARSVPLAENLRAWLEAYLPASGPVLPAKWATLAGLSELGRHIQRRTTLRWRKNAPRHSFATYYLAQHKDAPALVRAMGNSLTQVERHYWARSAAVTAEDAQAYFSIRPADNVISLSIAVGM